MIVFEKLTFANFLSVGNTPVSLNLNDCKTTLVHGTNGSGKSTILDALCYVLFNRSFRGVNLPLLLNTQNKKGLQVECEFKIGKDAYLIRRGMKPRLFEIFKNGEIIDNKAADKDTQAHLEQNILKLTYKSFTQIVILGSSNFVPFMQLNSAGRRECVEDFLDIKVFSTMATVAKERLRGLKEQYRILEVEHSSLEFKIDTLEDKIKEMSQRDEAEVEKYEKQIRDAEVKSLECEVKLKQWYEDVKTITEEIDEVDRKAPEKQLKKLNTVIIQMNAKLERLIKEKEFFNQDACPTCGQDIETALKNGAQGRIQDEMSKVDAATVQATEMMNKQQESLNYLLELNKRLRSYHEEIFKLQTQLKSHRKDISSCEKYLNSIKEMSRDTEKEQVILDSLQGDLKNMSKQKSELIGRIKDHDTVVQLLKESGIKTQIVKKYLPAMNRYVRHHLTELDFPIHFQLDEEFNEQVKSPLHQDFSYQSFSEGQKGRIDLALMFTWREIGRLKNSVTTNLLILDEVFSSSLDDTGKECLLQLLRYRLPDDQRIVVVDHTLSSTFREKFDNSIEVSRINGFSRYV